MRFGKLLLLLGVLFVALDGREVRAQAAEEAEGGSQVAVDEALAKRGQAVFRSKGCNACHTMGQRKSTGPDLVGATERRDLDWLTRFLTDPGPMLDSDPVAQELLKEFRGQRMPNMRLNEQEVQAVIHYIAQETARRGGK
jgi:mono/diheme cytochrome c family protein